MNIRLLQIALFVLASSAMSSTIAAQRINFGLYASDGITINTTGLDVLDFNQIEAIIVPGNDAIQILKNDEQSVILEIEGRIDLDVTITIDADPNLELEVTPLEIHTIPLSVRFAYHNVGLGVFETLPEETIKDQALEVPAGFNLATFAMRRRTSGPPTPPPTPDHEGLVHPRGKSYVVIYGNMGQVPVNAAVGLYEAQINIRVEYTNL